MRFGSKYLSLQPNKCTSYVCNSKDIIPACLGMKMPTSESACANLKTG